MSDFITYYSLLRNALQYGDLFHLNKYQLSQIDLDLFLCDNYDDIFNDVSGLYGIQNGKTLTPFIGSHNAHQYPYTRDKRVLGEGIKLHKLKFEHNNREISRQDIGEIDSRFLVYGLRNETPVIASLPDTAIDEVIEFSENTSDYLTQLMKGIYDLRHDESFDIDDWIYKLNQFLQVDVRSNWKVLMKKHNMPESNFGFVIDMDNAPAGYLHFISELSKKPTIISDHVPMSFSIDGSVSDAIELFQNAISGEIDISDVLKNSNHVEVNGCDVMRINTIKDFRRLSVLKKEESLCIIEPVTFLKSSFSN